jgi:CysZ protein
MPAIFTSLLLSLRQLGDPAVLRVLGKSLAVSLALFVLVAGAAWWGFDALLARAGLGDGQFTGAGDLRSIASLLLSLAGLWIGWRIVAMAVIQFFAEDVVRAVEARHYPQAASAAKDLTWQEQLRAGLGSAGRALILNLIALPFAVALIVTGIGPALLFWLVNALLIGREMQDMVWLRHRHIGDGLCPVSRFERFALGGAIAALLALPFIALLAPVLGAAAATHLVHRKTSA